MQKSSTKQCGKLQKSFMSTLSVSVTPSYFPCCYHTKIRQSVLFNQCGNRVTGAVDSEGTVNLLSVENDRTAQKAVQKLDATNVN